MDTYNRHRFPPDIISYALWLCFRFNLSYRDIEDFLAKRGIIFSREPRKIMTDKLRSYGVAHRELMPDVIHDNSQYANSRAEQSHEPTRVRAQVMRKFK